MAAQASNLIIEQVHKFNPQAYSLQLFDEAIIGFEQNLVGEYVLTYSVQKLLEELLSQGLTEIEAKQLLFRQVIPEHMNQPHGPMFRTHIAYISIQDKQPFLDRNYPLLTDRCDKICLADNSHLICPCSCHGVPNSYYIPID